jgi:hypothetical protein
MTGVRVAWLTVSGMRWNAVRAGPLNVAGVAMRGNVPRSCMPGRAADYTKEGE